MTWLRDVWNRLAAWADHQFTPGRPGWPGWLAGWLGLLAATWGVTALTMGGINSEARSAAEQKMRKVVWWAKVPPKQSKPDAPADGKSMTLVPTLDDLLEGEPATGPRVLAVAEVGAKNLDDLAPALRGVQPSEGEYWTRNDELTSKLFSAFFNKEPEDWFDRQISHVVPFQPLRREKLLRDDLGYTEVIRREDDDKQREQLLRHFGNLYGHLMKEMPCRLVRWVNGWVQVLAIAAFWLALLVAAKQYVQICAERRRANLFYPFAPALADGTPIDWRAPPAANGLWLTGPRRQAELVRLLDPEFGADPGILARMLRAGYEAYETADVNAQNLRDREAAAAAVERVAAAEHRRVDANMAALVYLGWCLPTLGFVGTVLGLGTALLTAGDMVTPVSELQRDAIQSVSIYLGRAFDKTFVALLLSLVLMAFVYGVRKAMEDVVLDFQDRVTRGVVGRLRG